MRSGPGWKRALAAVVWSVAAGDRPALADELLVPETYPSIQAAIVAAAPGDKVLVAPGTYVENVDFLGKALTVVGLGGPEHTRIDGGGAPVVRFGAGNGPDSTLRGFTVTNGTAGIMIGLAFGATGAAPNVVDCVVRDNLGPGIFGWGSEARIDDCVVADNAGPGVELQWFGDTTLRNCLVRGNEASFFGSGIYADESAVVRAYNCTIVGNTGVPGVYTTFDAHAELVNCIVRGNTSPQVATGIGSLDVRHSNVEGGFAGAGNLDADPLFVDAGAGDWRLQSLSPCVDAGDNGADLLPRDFFGDPRVGGGTVDLGFDEHHPLQGDWTTLSLGEGDVLTWRLDAGAPRGGESYLVLGSLSGTSPGVPLASGVLPLVPDGYFLHTLTHPNGAPLVDSLGVLDEAGVAQALFVLPPLEVPFLVGTTVHHAYASFDAFGAPGLVSNAHGARFVD